MESIIKKLVYLLPHTTIYFGYKFLFNTKFKKNQIRRTAQVSANKNSLIGFEKHKCIFIHIPKAAGVSLSQNLFGNLGGGHLPIYEYFKVYSPEEFKTYFKFTVVRNPWDRLVSAYHFLKEGGFNEVDKKWFNDNLAKYVDFEDFVLKWVNKKNINTFTHFIPQYYYLSLNGKILVDKIYNFENLEEAIVDINNKLDTSITLTHKNKTINRKNEYRAYYNEETKQIVGNVYKTDIELFHYQF